VSGEGANVECRRRPGLLRSRPPLDINALLVNLVFLDIWDAREGWLGSRVVSVQKGPVQIVVATLSGNSLRQTVYTHRASVHQAAKLVAALLRDVG